MNTDPHRGAVYERFELPHSFKPRLNFTEAVIGTLSGLLRVFLGSLLFAFWGAYSLLAWFAIHSPWRRVLAAFSLIAVFLLAFALLMMAITALARTALARLQGPPLRAATPYTRI